MKQALTIAGSDSSGGAGIQADLKTMHAHGVFGASVVTAVTAQNTVAVRDAYELPTALIEAQLDAVLDDLDIAAAKTGMLASVDIIRVVTAKLSARGPSALVVDPVMISKSGYKLLNENAIDALKSELIHMALVVTPNLHEAQLLADMTIRSTDDMKAAAERILEYGCRNVLIKGGHADFNRATDLLFDGQRFRSFEGEFIETRNLHGTGCTFSAAITARLALGEHLVEAISHAKIYISNAIRSSLDIGKGHGPTNHFYFVKPSDFNT
jgi:hydroxymethylpyrimidine/phosphomethylpyrimidine kinase